MKSALTSALAVVLCATLTACSPSASPEPSSSPEPSTSTAMLAPAAGASFGIYYGDGAPASTDAAIGSAPRIHLTYYGWRDEWATSSATTDDLAAGRVPLVNWEPFDVDFQDVVDGRFDDLIAERADQAKALGEDFFLDFAAEMNEEEGWGGHDPDLYVAAYRHIHDMFEEHDATNAVWVWAPNNVDSEGEPEALSYYPGDDYVDWTGMDGYNWGTSVPGFEWQSFEAVFADLYDDLVTLGKPVIIAETGSDDRGGNKPEWIADIVPTLRDRFPEIRAVVWFDVDKERHWQIDSSPASLAAVRAMAADPYFSSR